MLYFYISKNLDIQICEPTTASSFAWFPGRLSNLNQIFNRRPKGNLPSCEVDPACRLSYNPSISSSLHQQTSGRTVTVVLVVKALELFPLQQYCAFLFPYSSTQFQMPAVTRDWGENDFRLLLSLSQCWCYSKLPTNCSSPNIIFCGFCSNRILLYFPLLVCSFVRHRRDISHFSHI